MTRERRRSSTTGRGKAAGWLKPALFVAALVPFGLLAFGLLTGGLGANPVETITHESGQWTLRLLLVTLLVTPLRRATGLSVLVRLRRMLGLFAFFYLMVHFATYAVLDAGLDLEYVVEDLLERPYITVGFRHVVHPGTARRHLHRCDGPPSRWRPMAPVAPPGLLRGRRRGAALPVARLLQVGPARAAHLSGHPRRLAGRAHSHRCRSPRPSRATASGPGGARSSRRLNDEAMR